MENKTMSDKLSNAAETCAQGLKSDPELYYAVRQELTAHLEEAAKEYAEKISGHSPEDLALADFGNPAELAQEIASANWKRMKWRSVFRIFVPVLLILAALAVTWFTVSELFFDIKFYSLIRNREYGSDAARKNRALAEMYFKRGNFSENEKKLLRIYPEGMNADKNAEELGRLFPNDNVFRTAYLANLGSSRNHSILERRLLQFRQEEPQNALYDFRLSGIYLDRAWNQVKAKGKTEWRDDEFPRILTQADLNILLSDKSSAAEDYRKALSFFQSGLRKKYCRTCFPDLRNRQQKLLKTGSPFADGLMKYLYESQSIPEMTDFCLILNQGIPYWIASCLKNNRTEEARTLAYDSLAFVRLADSGSDFPYYRYFWCRMYDAHAGLLQRAVGKEEKKIWVAEHETYLNYLREDRAKRKTYDVFSFQKTVMDDFFCSGHLLHMPEWDRETHLNYFKYHIVKEQLSLDRLIIISGFPGCLLLIAAQLLKYLTDVFRSRKQLIPTIFILTPFQYSMIGISALLPGLFILGYYLSGLRGLPVMGNPESFLFQESVLLFSSVFPLCLTAHFAEIRITRLGISRKKPFEYVLRLLLPFCCYVILTVQFQGDTLGLFNKEVILFDVTRYDLFITATVFAVVSVLLVWGTNENPFVSGIRSSMLATGAAIVILVQALILLPLLHLGIAYTETLDRRYGIEYFVRVESPKQIKEKTEKYIKLIDRLIKAGEVNHGNQ